MRYFLILNSKNLFEKLQYEYAAKNTILLDLDNTLFSEIDYLTLAYKEFSKMVEERYEIPRSMTYDLIMHYFRLGYRSQILQFLQSNLLEYSPYKINLPFNDLKIALYFCLRDKKYTETLSLYSWAKMFFDHISDTRNIGVITNGNVNQQMNKISLLGLDKIIEDKKIICSNAFEPKPSTKVLKGLLDNMILQNPIFVGDSETDQKFAFAAGFRFLQVKHSKKNKVLIDNQ
jgi:FMN phosphatase YigB (HAD superfamily)